jgi:long-chain acyl-CoA synthetase
MTENTILHKLIENERIRPNHPAYYVKSDGAWVPTTWREYVSQVRQAARALIALGMEPKESVCILGFNRPEWVIMNLASMLAGGHCAGIYATNSPPEVHYVIEDSEARIVLVENEKLWNKIDQVRDQLPRLEHVIMMKDSQVDDPFVLDWESFLTKGDEVNLELVEQRLDGIKLEQLATLIYTSGTTGPPKGVMLSHNNLIWTAESGIELFDIKPTDSVISYLPLSHIAEQMFTVYTSVCSGYQVYFAQYPPQKFLNKNFREVSPTIVFSVPRIWEKFAEGVNDTLAGYKGIKAKLAAWAQHVGKEASTLKNKGSKPTGTLALQHKLADRLVFSQVKKALGLFNARYCLTGAAPIAPEIIEFFNSLDIPLMEIYGQSEDSGPTTVSRPGANRIGKVGQAWPGTKVKLAEDGEILVKGPNVFMGYYNNPSATASDLVDDWLHTGDLGEFDEDGFLTIIGRKKEILITSGGLNIAPKNIEAALMSLSLVSQAVCIGDKRRYITALITLKFEASTKFAQEHGVEVQELHTHPALIAEVKQAIDESVNVHFSRGEHVRNFCILHRDFSLEKGELTPTLKVKRRVVNENFHEEIEAMYLDS